MSPDSLDALVELIQSTPPADFRGLVVIKDGKLIQEEYFHTFWRETIHDVRSAGKSVTSLLFGIAIDKGYVDGEDQRLADVLSAAAAREASADGFQNITLRHVLTMTTGLDADDEDPSSPGRTGRWLTRDDWVDYMVRLPMRSEPGQNWVYTDVSPVLLGGIIREASGQTLSDFAHEHLFEPLGIREVYWYTGPGGQTAAMGNLYLTTLDFAKLGLLMLNEGAWSGEQIVSARWVRESTQAHVDISATSPFASSYGFMWYQGVAEVGDASHTYTFASGNGGNVLFIVPDENLVVAITSSAYGQGHGHPRTHNVFRRVLASIGSE